MKTIKAICLDCCRTQKDKELRIITTTAQLSLHGRFYPTHRIEMISAGDYDRKTGLLKQK